jgi:hypothetical protein
MWKPITDPRELESVSEPELFARVKPLLRRGSLATHLHRLNRMRPNIRGVCAELALEWQQDPRLNGREVDFGEYLAACLCHRLRQIDQVEYPHSYDAHRNYRPEGEPLPLFSEEADEPRTLPPALTTPDFAPMLFLPTLGASQLMQTTLTNMRIAGASQAGVFQTIDKFRSGEASTGYLVARELGYSREQARNSPATVISSLLRDLIPPNQPCATSSA